MAAGRRKDLTDYLRKLVALGYDWQYTNSRHIKITWHGQRVATCGSTPGGHRGFENLKAEIRRFERAKRTLTPGGITP